MGTLTLLVVGGSSATLAKLRALASDRGARLVEATGLDQAEDAEPVAVIVDLGLAGIEIAQTIRQRWPRALAAAFVTMPDRAKWEEAAAVFDLVATRGTIASELARRLETWTGPAEVARTRLFDAGDAVGRIGLVHRTDTPEGPVAVFNVNHQLCAVRDVCPHAGARLSDGPLSGTVVTCPKHGSQFDVRDGARVRGPSDEPIESFRVVVEAGTAWMETKPDTP